MKEITFAHASSLLAALHAEEAVRHRFAAQFILVSGLTAWQELLTALRAECTVFRLSERCIEEDLFPYLGGLRAQLEDAPGNKVLLLPLGELLHLVPEQVPLCELATWTPPQPKRVYIPVLERRDRLTSELAHIGRYLTGECVVWSLDGVGDIGVCAAPFPVDMGAGRTVQGMRAYLELWEEGGADKVHLISRWASNWSQMESVGRFSFSVCADGHSALCALVPEARGLSPAWGTEDEWRWIASQAHPGESFQHLAGRLLNFIHGDPQAVLEAWPRHTPQERWLAWLWARSLPKCESFAELAARESPSWQALPETAATIVFQKTLSPQHLAERRCLLDALSDEELPPVFWSTFEADANPITRLQALPGLTMRQQEQIVHEVAQVLQGGVDESTWMPILCLSFPALAAYLTYFPYQDVFVRDYMRIYTRSRVMDTPTPELLKRGLQWVQDRCLWVYPTRANLVREQASSGTRRLWVDALGVEWAGLLHFLLNNEQSECDLKLGRAELPSSTSFNREWVADEPVERRLDHTAHSLEYQHPRSLVQEVRFVEELARQISSFIQSNPEVLVTADHGLTRFAACGERVRPPEGWEVHKWGRFAQRSSGSADQSPSSNEWLSYNNCLILARHALFQGGTRTAGEVHGGGTLEEALVPVLAVRKRTTDRPTVRLLSDQLRPDREGVVRLTAVVSEPIHELRLSFAAQMVDAQRKLGNRWVFTLCDLPSGSYHGQLQYEGGFLAKVSFQVMQRGILQNDMGLPD